MIVFVLPLVIGVFWLAYFFMPPPRGLPILAYRNLTDLCSDGRSITSNQLNQHLQLIKELGYQTISFAELEKFRKDPALLPPKPVLLTFDGSYETICRVVYPVLTKHGLRGTVFVPASSIGSFSRLEDGIEKNLDHDMMRTLHSGGVEFALSPESNVDATRVEENIQCSITALEETGCAFSRVYAYPDKFNPRRPLRNGLRTALKTGRIDFAVQLAPGVNDLRLKNPYRLRRVVIRAGDTPRDLENKLIKGRGRWI